LYARWYHTLYEGGALVACKGFTKPVSPSQYLQTVASKITDRIKKSFDTAVLWRVQRPFTATENKLNELNVFPDKGGFLVGCQLGHLFNQINIEELQNQTIVLIFDIFANDGLGADRKVGPSRVVKRQIVRSFRNHFKDVLVMENLLSKMSPSEKVLIDPLKLHITDKETFISWVEVAVGYQAGLLINGGGHFSEVGCLYI